MPGIISLDENLTGFFCPACSSGNLGQQLEGPFSRPEIRKVQRKVRQDCSHQCDIRKVMPLGDQLGAHHYVDFMIMDSALHF